MQEEALLLSGLSHSLNLNEAKQVILCYLAVGPTTAGEKKLKSQRQQTHETTGLPIT